MEKKWKKLRMRPIRCDRYLLCIWLCPIPLIILIKVRIGEELNALYAQKGMADDILIVRNGYLTDTSIANVALYDGDTWFTPAHPLLRGTKRSEFLDRQLIVEKDIPQICLKDYSHIMLFNAMIDWKHIILPINEKHLIL